MVAFEDERFHISQGPLFFKRIKLGPPILQEVFNIEQPLRKIKDTLLPKSSVRLGSIKKGVRLG